MRLGVNNINLGWAPKSVTTLLQNHQDRWDVFRTQYPSIRTLGHNIEKREGETFSCGLLVHSNRGIRNQNRHSRSLCVSRSRRDFATDNSQVGYTVIAFSQTVAKKVDSKTHTNPLEGLLSQLKPRPGIVLLKRLNIVLDEDSEKGFGLVCSPSFRMRKNLNISLDQRERSPVQCLRPHFSCTNDTCNPVSCLPDPHPTFPTHSPYYLLASYTSSAPVPFEAHSHSNGPEKRCCFRNQLRWGTRGVV